jgi:hypothetical protein
MAALLNANDPDRFITGMTGVSTTVNNLLDAAGSGANYTDCRFNNSATLYTKILLGIEGSAAFTGGTLLLEWSFDGTNWSTGYLVRQDQASSLTSSSLSGLTRLRFIVNVEAPYCRLRVSVAPTGATISAYAVLTVNDHVSTHLATTVINTITTAISASSTSGTGASTNSVITPATAIAPTAVIKASQAKLLAFSAFNQAIVTRYLRFYNKSTAPTVGGDTGVIIARYPLPAGVYTNQSIVADIGALFSAGLGYTITSGFADTDTGVLAANDIILNVHYI